MAKIIIFLAALNQKKYGIDSYKSFVSLLISCSFILLLLLYIICYYYYHLLFQSATFCIDSFSSIA